MTAFSRQTIRTDSILDPHMISPFNPTTHLGPASYDLTLDEDVLLWPGRFALRSSVEYIRMPDDVIGTVTGRSSVGRLGIFVIVSAGFVDPGFYGRITLEIVYAQPWYKILWPSAWRRLRAGTRIAQIAFIRIDQATDMPYRGQYYGQLKATASRLDEPNWINREAWRRGPPDP